MMRKISLIISLVIFTFTNLNAIEISKIEPPSWWIGMNSSTLQLMIYGKDISGANIISENSDIKVVKVHNADSPNYLFVDLMLKNKLKAGLYNFKILKGSEETTFKYAFEKRRPNSGLRESFGPQDIVYLLMPDRFSNWDTSNDNSPDADEKSQITNPYGRHGGDIRGMINSLDYLKDLG
ncbi:MAG: cyclomaltodextrinase N-terminal domain-containing protein, partial [Bacteroidales bacterium]|nr:cyclomaltodextrinase N-terminal domain-containing protein [Bacteroidales bacterium]